MEVIIEKLKTEARKSWSGEVGEDRARNLEKYLRNKLDEYSIALNLSKMDLLNAWEEQRNYSAINYYQEANQPSINKDRVKVFKSVDEMLQAIGDKKFRCPSCSGISTNPYECNSGKEMSQDKVCDWKVYGLFQDLGKGVHIFCKDKMQGETIFMPLSWEKVKA